MNRDISRYGVGQGPKALLGDESAKTCGSNGVEGHEHSSLSVAIRALLGAAFAILAFSSCSYRNLKSGDGVKDGTHGGVAGKPGDSTASGRIDFVQVQAVVIGPRCLNCHSAARGNQGGVNLEGYANVHSQLDAIKSRALVEKTMPPRSAGPLSASEVTLLSDWIDKGAPEVEAGGGPPAGGPAGGPANPPSVPDHNEGTNPSPKVVWEDVEAKVFSRSCIQCHSQPAPSGGLDLTSPTDAKSKATQIFKRVMVDQDMPLAPFPKATQEEKRLVSEWILQGLQ